MTVLGVVLAASALDLTLGLLWVVALVGVLLLRRRIRLVAPLVLLAAAALLVWGGRLGWFPPPAPASYETGWVPRWRESRPAPSPAAEPRVAAARERLAALAREELRLTGPEIEQRAGAVIALARRLDPVRARRPGEVAAVEASARRLARTLAAAEFRNLEARRAAAAAYLAELDRRIAVARDVERDDHRPAGGRCGRHGPRLAAPRARGSRRRGRGGGSARARARRRCPGGDDRGDCALRREREQDATGRSGTPSPGRPESGCSGLETRAFRSAAPSGAPLSLTYAPGGEAPRAVPPGAWTELEPAPRGVVVVAAWPEPVVARRVRGPLLVRPRSSGST